MKYFRYVDEWSPIGAGMTYVEVADGGTIRQITIAGEDRISSNICHSRWGIGLAEGRVDYESISEVMPITQSEFESIWQAHLKKHEPEWIAAKNAYPVGIPVKGYIQIFYPQGVIVNLGRNVLGVADYKACKSSTSPEFLYTRHIVTAVVSGYDETNHWIVLDSPQVHNQSVPLGGPEPGQ